MLICGAIVILASAQENIASLDSDQSPVKEAMVANVLDPLNPLRSDKSQGT